MSNEEILQIIADNSLCVRRLPFETVSYWSYTPGDENKIYVDPNGNKIESLREVVTQKLDLEYFQKAKPIKWSTRTPEQRYQAYLKAFPNGKKLLKETKKVNNGGWWYVKQAKNTDSTVIFNREYDTYFAPTIEQAIKLYLKAIGR